MAQVRIRKRGKTFSYIFEAGKVDGKRKVVEKGGFATKAEAYKAGVAAYNDFLHGNIGITSESITLKDFMTTWLDNVVASNAKPTTLQEYRIRFQKHIAPYLGEVKIQELTPAMLDKWIRNLQNENEKQFDDSYIYVYRESDGHIQRQSRGLPVTAGEKISLVCTRDDGQPIFANYVTNILRIEGLNAHSFRHTHATQLIENGAAPKGVAGRLGHSNTQITQNLYTHNTLKLQKETAAIFAENLQTKP